MGFGLGFGFGFGLRFGLDLVSGYAEDALLGEAVAAEQLLPQRTQHVGHAVHLG